MKYERESFIILHILATDKELKRMCKNIQLDMEFNKLTAETKILLNKFITVCNEKGNDHGQQSR